MQQQPPNSQPPDSQPSQFSQFRTATDVNISQQLRIHITTGSPDLDYLLGNGIRCGEITEIIGPANTGKTQLCHTLSVTAQLPDNMNGGFGKTLFVDCEQTFKAQRVSDIAARFDGVDRTVIMDNVTCATVRNADNLCQLLDKAEALFQKHRYALVVIDGAISLYKSEFHGAVRRAQLLTHLMEKLQKLTRNYGVAVVVTTRSAAAVVRNSSLNSVADSQANIVEQLSTTRLSLRKGQSGRIVCAVLKSPNAETDYEAAIKIGLHGIVDSQ